MSIIVRATQRLHQVGARDPHPARAQDPFGADAPGAAPSSAPRRQAETVALDYAALTRAGFLDPYSRKSRLGEELRLVKRRLLQEVASAAEDERLRPGPPSNVVLVTSTRGGEGKTFTAINLAISLAMDERRKVLLMDCDPVKRSTSITLGLHQRPGITDALRDEGGPDPLDLLVHDAKLPLSVLPAGTSEPSATDIFGGERMAVLLERAASQVEDGVVIIDAPPILATSEPLALAHRVGHVLMVVEAGKTPRSAIHTALDRLGMDDRVCMVLNRLPPHLGPAQAEY